MTKRNTAGCGYRAEHIAFSVNERLANIYCTENALPLADVVLEIRA